MQQEELMNILEDQFTQTKMFFQEVEEKQEESKRSEEPPKSIE